MDVPPVTHVMLSRARSIRASLWVSFDIVDPVVRYVSFEVWGKIIVLTW